MVVSMEKSVIAMIAEQSFCKLEVGEFYDFGIMRY